MQPVASVKSSERLLLGGDLFQRVLGHGGDSACGIDQARGRADLGEHAVFGLAVALAAVELRPSLRGCLIIAGERLVRFVRDAVLQHGVVEHADQAVAAADAGIEEGERLAWLQRLDPEGHLAQLDRERIAIDAVDTVRDDLAQRALELDLGRRTGAPVLRDAGGRAARGAEQEMSGPASGIEDRKLQDRGYRVVGVRASAASRIGSRAESSRSFTSASGV